MTPSSLSPRPDGHRALVFFIASVAAIATASLLAAARGSGSTDEPATAGADLYAANCASCHGSDLRGTQEGPSHLSVV
jgi:ubiquinol-cytochrome c reductase cytochrome c subunit